MVNFYMKFSTFFNKALIVLKKKKKIESKCKKFIDL